MMAGETRMPDYLPAQLEHAHKPEKKPEASPLERRPNPHPLVALQARAGNQAVARMVQRAGEEDELQMKHDRSLQRESEGPEEEEEQVQAKHDPSIQRESEGAEEEEEQVQAKHDASLQRAGEEDELQMKHDASLQRAGEEDELQMKHDSPTVGLEGGPVGADTESRINSMRGGGSAVPSGIRGQMEAATGVDLGGVRVHQDQQSDSLNRQLTAKAFTTGKDVFLRSDASAGDSHLMAHELAHVVQQSSGRTADAGGSGMTAGAANDPLEHEADDLANKVLSGQAPKAEEAAV
jgi:hypothetical protein